MWRLTSVKPKFNNTNTGSDSDSNSDTNTNTNTKTKTNTDSDTNTNTDSDTNNNSNNNNNNKIIVLILWHRFTMNIELEEPPLRLVDGLSVDNVPSFYKLPLGAIIKDGYAHQPYHHILLSLHFVNVG